MIVQWLYANTVSNQVQFTLHRVEKGEGPHPIETIQTFNAPFGIAGEDHLSVSFRPKTMAGSSQLIANLTIVVDLTVVNDPVSPIPITHGLMAGVRKIHDAQPTVAKNQLPRLLPRTSDGLTPIDRRG
jgi:hypothetical protein